MPNNVHSEPLKRQHPQSPSIRPIEKRVSGEILFGQAAEVFDATDIERSSLNISEKELRAIGTFVTIEGAEAIYPLKLESLDRKVQSNAKSAIPNWMLMSVQPASDEEPERAIVWVSDSHRKQFLQLFEDYASELTTQGKPENWETPNGNPKNRGLVANIAQVRRTFLRDLWQSDGNPPEHGEYWWELWIAKTLPADQILSHLAMLHIQTATRTTIFQERIVVWVKATWTQLEFLPFSDIPLAEIRCPSLIDTIEDFPQVERAEWVDDLANRISSAPTLAPAVCHLDTGVARNHVLLTDSLRLSDMNTVVGTSGFDLDGHGTKMAGIALFGNLDETLASSSEISLRHRLESVRILPSKHRNEKEHNPLDYGTVTAEAVSIAEITASRPRVYCMPVTTEPDKSGDPTLWSATVDALCVGTVVVTNKQKKQLELLGAPDPEASRLVVVSAGNTDLRYATVNFEPKDISDTSMILDPAQAWNALTVGAYTDMMSLPSSLELEGGRTAVPAGELSPHSRTSILFGDSWPNKPDICMEGGNVLINGTSLDLSNPSLSVRTTGIQNDQSVTSANATSAATAAASRLAALAMAEYPDYWPETIRALLVHAAKWTPIMEGQIKSNKLTKTRRRRLLRRYGWGVPTEDAVLHSSRSAVTMVVQDKFVPFDGDKFRLRQFRLHELPWPRQVLQSISSSDVSVRITLSYFVEPNPSRRGWKSRYSYASHSLRFELKAPGENDTDFAARINREGGNEEAGMPRPSNGNDGWLIGPGQRNTGSLHQDIWEGTGAELALCDKIAVYPVGGWWKNNEKKSRVNQPIRYALLVSLTTNEQGIDLYTPIASQLHVPSSVAVSSI